MKKFVRAEIYTLIEKLKDVMVVSYSRSFQNLCKEVIDYHCLLFY